VSESRVVTLADGLDEMQLEGPEEAPAFVPVAYPTVTPTATSSSSEDVASFSSEPKGDAPGNGSAEKLPSAAPTDDSAEADSGDETTAASAEPEALWSAALG
jgi:hypothetical protein